MRSIGGGDNIEVRHFMDDEHQITIGLDRSLWPLIQRIANQAAADNQWLGAKGSEWEYLNIWIVGLVAQCPRGVEAHEWITDTVNRS
ncbi:MAG: hypothetical protein NVV60_11760 [Luteimonas sp.]|nr:hypothetical protein [Luteimonas sp.]